MKRLIVAFLGALSLSGCLLPTDESPWDATQSPEPNDAGLVGAPDAGYPRKNCQAPDSGLYFAVSSLPAGCTHFKGNLVGINQDFSMTNASSLEEIDGTLLLKEGIWTLDLKGFESLRRISGALDLSGLGGLSSTSAMKNLTSVGSVNIYLCNKLRDIDLPALEVVERDFRIVDNAELQSLAGLRSLRSIGGRFESRYNRRLSSVALQEFRQRVAIDGGVP